MQGCHLRMHARSQPVAVAVAGSRSRRCKGRGRGCCSKVEEVEAAATTNQIVKAAAAATNQVTEAEAEMQCKQRLQPEMR